MEKDAAFHGKEHDRCEFSKQFLRAFSGCSPVGIDCLDETQPSLGEGTRRIDRIHFGDKVFYKKKRLRANDRYESFGCSREVYKNPTCKYLDISITHC